MALLALAMPAWGCLPVPCDDPSCEMVLGRDPTKAEGTVACTAGAKVMGRALIHSCHIVEDGALAASKNTSVCRVGGVKRDGSVAVSCTADADCEFEIDAFTMTSRCECRAPVEKPWLEYPCPSDECYNPEAGACVDSSNEVPCLLDPCEAQKCPRGSVCRRSDCGGCHAQCVAPLEEGGVCRSGGVTSGRGVDRVDECPEGTECLPTSTYAIGGEVPWTCQQPVQCELEDGRTFKPGKRWKADDGCNKCRCLEDGTVACTEKVCEPALYYMDRALGACVKRADGEEAGAYSWPGFESKKKCCKRFKSWRGVRRCLRYEERTGAVETEPWFSVPEAGTCVRGKVPEGRRSYEKKGRCCAREYGTQGRRTCMKLK
eukprot:TRINITY_DN517_c0_g1_i11.p1 TRINITY_DN517_c0_g1~~TRINITY_DN517_c0_g1_i11.p1  ORF type:complete len:400 (+),score=122.43 TRINITY_DN517_c0_g1_i11:79-1200(+)